MHIVIATIRNREVFGDAELYGPFESGDAAQAFAEHIVDMPRRENGSFVAHAHVEPVLSPLAFFLGAGKEA